MAASAEASQHGRLHPDATWVRHGRWTFELRAEEVADIRYDGVVLLRAVRPVVRDQDWNTFGAELVRQRSDISGPLWSAQLDLEFRHADLAYRGELAVRVTIDTIEVAFTGAALTPFRRNRIGLVVLHPADEAGRSVVRIAPDGSEHAGRWPEQVAPAQPFREVQGFRWQRGHVAAQLDLAGDLFETEDQRNWTDASFKTYSTPLDLPFPVEVSRSDRVMQTVRLTATATGRPAPVVVAEQSEPVVISHGQIGVVPQIATVAVHRTGPGQDGGPAPALRVGSLVVELAGPADGWSDRLTSAARTAEQVGASLDVRLVTDDPGWIEDAVAHPAVGRADRLAVFDPVLHVTTPPLWVMLAAAARSAGCPAVLVAGARSHFTELNRQTQLLPAAASALTFSMTPQMHAIEVAHIVDSLQGQRAVLRSAKALSGGRPLHLGPVTLRPRFNAVATSGDAAGDPADPLQATPFAAAWTLGSIATLTDPDVAGLCYYEIDGPGGWGVERGELYPVGTLLVWLAAAAGRPVLRSDSPAGITAYPVADPTGVDVLLANLTDRRRSVAVHRLGSSPEPQGPGTGSDVLVLEPWSVGHLRR